MIGARTHESIILEQYIFRAEIEKYFRSFLVQMKTAKSPFEINWPLVELYAIVQWQHNVFSKVEVQMVALKYSTPPHLRYPELRYIRSNAILNWVPKTPS